VQVTSHFKSWFTYNMNTLKGHGDEKKEREREKNVCALVKLRDHSQKKFVV